MMSDELCGVKESFSKLEAQGLVNEREESVN